MLIFWLFFIVESLVLMVMRGHGELALDDSIYWVCIILNSVVLIACIAQESKSDTFLVRFMALGYLLRLVFLIWVQYFSHILLLPNAGFDEFMYYFQAKRGMLGAENLRNGYCYFVLYQAKVFGLSLLYCRYVNLLFSMMAIFVFSRALILLNVSQKTYRRTMILACLLPNFALLSCLLLRESLIFMLLSMACYCLIYWWNNGDIKYIVVCLMFSMLAARLHTGAIAFACGVVVAFICSSFENGHRVLHILNLRNILLSLAVLLVSLLYMHLHNSEMLSYVNNVESLSDIAAQVDTRETGSSSYSSDIVANDSLVGFIINSPLHIINFLFSPLPWQWRGLSDILAFFMSSVFYLYVTFLLVKNRDILSKSEIIPVFVIIAAGAGFLFGWGVANAGTALRHRDKFVFAYLAIFALVEEYRNNLGMIGYNKSRTLSHS